MSERDAPPPGSRGFAVGATPAPAPALAVSPTVPAQPATGRRGAENDALLTPSEVASMFRVDPRTVTRWARSGKIDCVRTLGGHRRFRQQEVLALLERVPEPRGA